MKIKQNKLQLGLKVIGNIVKDNDIIPVLSNVFFKFNGKLNLITNNSDIIFSYLIDTDNSFDNFLVNCNLLKQSTSCLDGEYIELNKIDKKITIESENNKISINTQEDTFPDIPEYKKDNHIQINKKVFYESILGIVFATATNDMKIELSGVLFDVQKNKITLVSTDGIRLAKKEIIQENNFEVKKIIPIKVLNELIRIIPLLDFEFIDIYISDGTLVFEINDVVIISRTIEGNYPDYKQIIPNEFDFKVEVNKKKLLQSLKLSSIFSDNNLKDTVLKFKNNELEVFSNSGRKGEGTSKIEIENIIEKEIKFNHDFLLDAINNIKNDKLMLSFDNTKLILSSIGNNDYINIIMALKE